MRRLFLLLTAVVLSSACEDTLGGIDEDIAGDYDLITIDGDQLPITFVDTDSVDVAITDAEIKIGLNGVYREIDTFQFTRASGVSTQVDTFTAVWTIGANNLLTVTTQTSQGPLTLMGAWNGTNTLTFDVGGLEWVWRQR